MSWVRSSRNNQIKDQIQKKSASWVKSSTENEMESSSPWKYLHQSVDYWVHDLKEILKKPTWGSDLTAGITIAAVALPLNLALAVASGLPASTGIISGAIGGFLAGLFGGSRWQVSGPAAALNVMVFTIVATYGVAGAAAAALFCGVFSISLSLFGLGKWMNQVPEAVIAGFTTGVGLKLLDQQIPHLFGVDI
jgi:SulP family sulfate permease